MAAVGLFRVCLRQCTSASRPLLTLACGATNDSFWNADQSRRTTELRARSGQRCRSPIKRSLLSRKNSSGKPMRSKVPVSAIWRKRGGRWLQRYSQEIDTSLRNWQDFFGSRTWLTRSLRCRPVHCAIGQSPAAVQSATDRCPGRAGHSRETPPDLS